MVLICFWRTGTPSTQKCPGKGASCRARPTWAGYHQGTGPWPLAFLEWPNTSLSGERLCGGKSGGGGVVCALFYLEKEWFLLSMDVLLCVKLFRQDNSSLRRTSPRMQPVGHRLPSRPLPPIPPQLLNASHHSQPLDNLDTPTHFQPPSGWKLLMSSWYSLLGLVTKTATDVRWTLLK